MASAFIAHASQDREVARDLFYALARAGVDAFLDDQSLAAGEEYHKKLQERILSADYFVFLISPHSVAKGSYCLTELRHAEEKWARESKGFLPVMIREVATDQLPAFLRQSNPLRPRGNVSAEVLTEILRQEQGVESDHLDRLREMPPPPSQKRPLFALPIVIAFASLVLAALCFIRVQTSATNGATQDDVNDRIAALEDRLKEVEFDLGDSSTLTSSDIDQIITAFLTNPSFDDVIAPKMFGNVNTVANGSKTGCIRIGHLQICWGSAGLLAEPLIPGTPLRVEDAPPGPEQRPFSFTFMQGGFCEIPVVTTGIERHFTVYRSELSETDFKGSVVPVDYSPYDRNDRTNPVDFRYIAVGRWKDSEETILESGDVLRE